MADEAQISVRFTSRDTESVKKALQQLGEDGQRALAKLEAASRKPSEGLNAINAAARDGRDIIDSYAARLGPFGSALTAMGPVGLTAAASLTGIGIAAKSSFSALATEARKTSVLVDVADKVGFSVEKFQAYRFAANQAGVSTTDFESALETLAKRTGDAMKGTGELYDAAKRYRISLVDASGAARSQEAIFRDIIRTMSSLSTQQERLALSSDAFGKGVGQITTFAAEGVEAMDKQAAAANRLGIVLDEKAARGAKKLADELDRIKAIGEAAYTKALLGERPEEIAENIKAMEDWEKAWNSLKGTVMGAAPKIMALILETTDAYLSTQPQFIQYTATLEKHSQAVASAMSDMDYAMNLSAGSTGRTAQETADLRKEYKDLVGDVGGVVAIEQRRTDRLNRLWDMLTSLAITNDEFAKGQALVNQKYREELQLNERREKQFKSINQQIIEQIVNNNLLLAAMHRSEYEGRVFAKTQELMQRGFKGTTEEAQHFAEVLLAQEDSIASLNDMWSRMGEELPKLAKENFESPLVTAVENTVDGIKDAFDNTFYEIFRHGKISADDFLSDLLDMFARTLAEMATLALAQPIIVPMVASMGSALGLSNQQIDQVGQGFGVSNASNFLSLANNGFNFSALGTSVFPNFAMSSMGQTLGLSTAAGMGPGGMMYGTIPGLGSGTTLVPAQLTGLGKTFNVMSSPMGMLGGTLGSMLPSLLGFKPRKGPGDEIGSLAGTAGGAYLATTAALSMIPGVNFFAPFIGAALGKVIGGLFGAKPSSQQEVGTLWLGSGAREFNDLGPGKNNAEFETQIRSFLDVVADLKTGLEKATGGRVTTGYTTLSIDKRNGTQLIIDGNRTTVGSTEDAVRAVAQAFVASIEGITPEIKAALDNVDWTGDLQQAAQDVDFIVAFKPMIEALRGGALSIKDSVKQAAAEEIRAITTQIKDFKDNAARLGLSTQDAADATKTFVERLVGLKDAAGEKSAVALGLEALQGRFEALGPLLEEVGITTPWNVLYDQERNRQADGFDANWTARYRASAGLGSLNDLTALTKEITTARGDAALFGRSTDTINNTFRNEVGTILDNAIGSSKSLEDAQRVLNAIKQEFAAFPEIVAAADARLQTLAQTFGVTASAAEAAAQKLERERSQAARARDILGFGYINSVQDLLDSDAAERAANLASGSSNANLDTIFSGSLANIMRQTVLNAGDATAAAAALNKIKTDFAAFPAVVAAANEALGNINETLGETARKDAARKSQTYRARDVLGFGYINDVQDLLDSDAAERAQNLKDGISNGNLDTILSGTLKNIMRQTVLDAGDATAAAAALNKIKTDFAAFPAVVAAANEALGNINETLGITAQQAAEAAAAQEASLQRVDELLMRETSARIAAVQEQLAAAENLKAVMASANRKIEDALLGFRLGNSGFMTPQARMAANEDYFFNDLAKRALLGDTDALDQVGQFGTELVTMAQQMWGNTSPTMNVQNRVRAVLEQARDLTARQSNIAQDSLDTARSSLNVLQQIADLLGGRGNQSSAYTTQDLDNLIGRYNQAAAAGGEGFIGSSGYGVYVSQANAIYAGMSDKTRLQSDLGFYKSNLGGAHGAAYQGYVDTITNRLRALGVPGYAAGGDHMGGLRIVGERGIELESTGRSRIFNARQTQSIMAGAMADAQGLAGPVRETAAAANRGTEAQYATRDEVAALRKETQDTNRLLRRYLDRSIALDAKLLGAA